MILNDKVSHTRRMVLYRRKMLILILLVDRSHAFLSGTEESEETLLMQQHGLDHPSVLIDVPSLECACDFSKHSSISSDRERDDHANSQLDMKKFAEHEQPATGTPQSPSSFSGSGADKNIRYHLLKSAAEDFWAESDISYHNYRQVLVGDDEKRFVHVRQREKVRERDSYSGVGARQLHSLSPSLSPTSFFLLFFSLTVKNTGAFWRAMALGVPFQDIIETGVGGSGETMV
jgi:hypothetical protein